MSCEACSVSNTSCSGCNSPKPSTPSQPQGLGFGVSRGGGFRERGGFLGRIGGFPFNRQRGFFQQLPLFYTQPYFYQPACALDANLPADMQTVVRSALSSGSTAVKQALSTLMRDLGYPLAAGCLVRGY